MRFTVEFIGENSLPFFEPALVQLFQVYKQPSPFFWSYDIPNALDDDIADTLTTEVDITSISGFAELV